jgi:hypothetical protein
MKGNISRLLNAYPRCPKIILSLNDAFKNTSDWLLNPLWFSLQQSGSEEQFLLHHNKEKEKHFEAIKRVIKFFQYKSGKKREKHKILKFRPYVMYMGTYFLSVA